MLITQTITTDYHNKEGKENNIDRKNNHTIRRNTNTSHPKKHNFLQTPTPATNNQHTEMMVIVQNVNTQTTPLVEGKAHQTDETQWTPTTTTLKTEKNKKL